MAKFTEYLGGLWKRLMELQGSPHAIAGGVAIGIFFGFTPLFGFKTLLCLGACAIFRLNPIAAVLAVTLHDIVTPLWPVILRVEYEIGYWLLSNPHVLPPKMDMHHLKVAELFTWDIFVKIGVPIMLGGILFALPFSAVTYAAFFTFLTRRQKRQLAARETAGVGDNDPSSSDDR